MAVECAGKKPETNCCHGYSGWDEVARVCAENFGVVQRELPVVRNAETTAVEHMLQKQGNFKATI